MAKGMYVGASNIAQKGKKAYFGVDNVARKVKRIYVGENNVAKLAFNSNPAESSNVMIYGSNKKFYVNNNMNYSIDKLTEYADATGLDSNVFYFGINVSPKGRYYYYSSSSAFKIYRLEEGNITLYDTLEQSRFPASVIGSGTNYNSFVVRGCCFSYDEQYFYVTTHNIETRTNFKIKYFYVSSFKVTESGLEHISTKTLPTYPSDSSFNLRGMYVAVAENAMVLAVNLIYNRGDSSSSAEYRQLFRIELNSDYSLGAIIGTGEKVNSGGSQTIEGPVKQGDVAISANGLWIATYYFITNSSVKQGTAYLHYFSSNSLQEKTNMWFGDYFGGFKMSRNRLLGFGTTYSSSENTAYFNVFTLNDDGTYTASSIIFDRTPILYSLNNFFAINGSLSRDGTTIVTGNTSYDIFMCKLDYTAKTLTISETAEIDSVSYLFAVIINDN